MKRNKNKAATKAEITEEQGAVIVKAPDDNETIDVVEETRENLCMMIDCTNENIEAAQREFERIRDRIETLRRDYAIYIDMLNKLDSTTDDEEFAT